MNSRLALLLFALLTLTVPITGHGQTVYRVGFMPSINLSSELGKGWGLFSKLESRQTYFEALGDTDTDWNYNYVLTDLMLAGSKRLGLNKSLVAGYRIRFVNGTIFHETRQQFTIVKTHNTFRMGYRFMTTQLFGEDISPVYRLRFRLTAIVPLSGESVDPKEFYLKVSNEYLGILNADAVNYEIRLIPILGYEFNDNNKLEFGLDYRLSSLFETTMVSTFWVTVSWYIRPFR